MKLKSLIVLFAIFGMAAISSCQTETIANKVKLETKTDSASYALGVLIGENNKRQMEMTPGAKELNVDILVASLAQALKGKEVSIDTKKASQLVRDYFEGTAKKLGQKNLEEGKAFLEANKSKSGVVTLPSGLQYQIIKEGTGPKPLATDDVKCHYHGTFIDGKVFDSSVEKKEPATFPVNGVIPGWVEALQLMPVGSKWKLFIPSELAYGEKGAGAEIGPNCALVFEVELLEIVKK